MLPIATISCICLSVSLLLPLATPTTAVATDVGGQITSNTTWTKANSPYVVTGNLLVAQAATLTIQPGVEVRFNSAKSMLVDGCLVARGTEAEPILFVSNLSSPALGSWNGITFSSTSVGATLDANDNYVSGSILEYCQLRHARGVILNSSSPLIAHCTIEYCTGAGVYGGGIWMDGTRTAVVLIRNCTIRNNDGTYGGGISVYGTGSAKIMSNIIQGNGAEDGGGICICALAGGTVDVVGNTISGNEAKGYGAGITIWSGNANVRDNTIQDNGGEGSPPLSVSGGGIAVKTTTPAEIRIEHNVIVNNSENIVSGGGIYVEGGAWIGMNTISNNAGGIQVKSGGCFISNTISNNVGDGINITGGCTMLHNEVSGNSNSGVHFQQGGSGSLHYSNIHGNLVYDLHNEALGSWGNVDASSNWWGTTTESEIQARIYDWSDDSRLGIVQYAPYLTGEADTDSEIPTVTGVVPSSGSRGQTVNATISGTGFAGGTTTVNFGLGLTVQSFAVVSDSQITATVVVPSSTAIGPKDVTVTASCGTAVLANGFTVVSASTSEATLTTIGPGQGARGQNVTVTINGTNLSGATAVTFGSGITTNTFTVDSSVKITASITIDGSTLVGARDVSVTTPSGVATKASGFTVVSQSTPAPTVSSLSPAKGSRGKTLTVTISGTNFYGAAAVRFGAGITVEDFTANSSTEITAEITIDADAAKGARDVSVTIGGVTATNTGGFTVVGGGGGICSGGALATPSAPSEMTTTLAALGLLLGVGYLLVTSRTRNRRRSVRA
jgi:parallel beta-helix repeat protein